MRVYENGRYRDMTEQELETMQTAAKEAERREKLRPRTIEEGMLELNREILQEKIAGREDKTLAIACMAFFQVWEPGAYAVGDVRTDPETGYPRECMIAHDSRVNTDWTVKTPSVWKPCHSRKKEYALPWEQPSGAHDQYKAGEYMVWTDGDVYLCKSDTGFSPADYADAWETVQG